VNYDVIIVDNASPDASMDKFVAYMEDSEIEHFFFNTPENAMNEPTYSSVSLIQSGFNGGYGYGNNIGIKYALINGADFVLIINNDTVVDPAFLEPMVQMCEKDHRIGIASGKIYFYDRPDTFWFNGGKINQCTAKVEHFNFNEKDVGQNINEPVTFISGCMWLIPKNIFKNVGFINEEYFMYVEDLEYCQRILNRGYTLKISNDTKILHKVGGSSGLWSEFFAYWMARNKMKFIGNFEKGLCLFSAYSYHIVYTSMWWLLHKRYDLFKSHIKGIWSVVAHKGND